MLVVVDGSHGPMRATGRAGLKKAEAIWWPRPGPKGGTVALIRLTDAPERGGVPDG